MMTIDWHDREQFQNRRRFLDNPDSWLSAAVRKIVDRLNVNAGFTDYSKLEPQSFLFIFIFNMLIEISTQTVFLLNMPGTQTVFLLNVPAW